MKDLRYIYFICLSLITFTVFSQHPKGAENATILFNSLLDSSDNHYNSGNYKKSIEFNIQAVKIALNLKEPNLIYKGYRYLAYDYLALKDTLLAKENFQKSKEYALKTRNDTVTATVYMDLANLYSSLEGEYEMALRYHKLSIRKFRDSKDTINLAKAHYNTVLTTFDKKDFNQGIYNLIKAEEFMTVLDDPAFSAGVANLYGDYYSFKQEFDKAEREYLKAIEIGKKNNLTIELENSYQGYSKALSEMGFFERAYDARLKFDTYLEENLRLANTALGSSASSKFQVSEYRKKAEEAEAETQLQAELTAEKSRHNKILWIISGLALLAIIFLAYGHFRRKILVEKLRLKNAEYLQAKQESEKLAKMKAKFFSTVSHELRTPLYGVIGLSTLLLENEDLKKHEKDLKSLKFSADYLLALINDVLQINKIESETLKEDGTAFDLRELVGTIVSSFDYIKIQHNNKIVIEVDEDIPSLLKGNSVRLSQVLMNLIGNACKFTRDGTIHILAKINKANTSSIQIAFMVKDTGIGIAENKLETIFNEFSQIDSSNRGYQGTGLGLPIVKKLLEQVDSKIVVESEPDKGSSFSFKLLFEALEGASISDEEPLTETTTLNGRKILIVEDNKINQTVTEKILSKEGAVCEIAENGAIAINKIKESAYDLVLMDINMPVKNGIEATREIREFNTQLPIIALTAVEIEEMRYRILDCGMNDIIVKPYDVRKFRKTIAKNLYINNSNTASHLQIVG